MFQHMLPFAAFTITALCNMPIYSLQGHNSCNRQLKLRLRLAFLTMPGSVLWPFNSVNQALGGHSLALLLMSRFHLGQVWRMDAAAPAKCSTPRLTTTMRLLSHKAWLFVLDLSINCIKAETGKPVLHDSYTPSHNKLEAASSCMDCINPLQSCTTFTTSMQNWLMVQLLCAMQPPS